MFDIPSSLRVGLVVVAALLIVNATNAQEQSTGYQNTAAPAAQVTPPAAAESGTPAAAGSGTSADTRRLGELFYQLQVLQQEVQELRGLVEEQSYQLKRLSRDQQEQYIDLDRRIAGMGSGSRSAASTRASGTAGSGSLPLSTAPIAASPSGAGAGERDVYTRAFELMKARQFEESIAGFNQLITTYPNGQYTPNAFYWLGELYLAKTETEQARQSFAQVLNLYPDHPKVPDTLYKLGVVYHRLGDTNRALGYFRQVRDEYSDSSAAGLATRYMAELQ